MPINYTVEKLGVSVRVLVGEGSLRFRLKEVARNHLLNLAHGPSVPAFPDDAELQDRLDRIFARVSSSTPGIVDEDRIDALTDDDARAVALEILSLFQIAHRLFWADSKGGK